MNLSLYENASALRGLEQYQNVIANNIAASHVAGFKKVAVSFEAVEGELSFAGGYFESSTPITC